MKITNETARGVARARELLSTVHPDFGMPSAEEVAKAQSILARVNGAKGGKSRSKKKLAALAKNREKIGK